MRADIADNDDEGVAVHPEAYRRAHRGARRAVVGTVSTVCRGELAVYGDERAAARLFDGLAKIVKREPNRTFADDEVRVSGRRLAHLILLRLDGEVPDDDD